MMPPGVPGMPGAGGAPPTRAGGRRANGNGHRPSEESAPTTLLVRPHSGFGVSAEFDPATGALQATSIRSGVESGVYGDLAGVPVVFFRHDSRLAVRIGGQLIELDEPVTVDRLVGPQRLTTLTISAGPTVLCSLTYRTLPAELDIGLFLRDVCADPGRRARVFA